MANKRELQLGRSHANERHCAHGNNAQGYVARNGNESARSWEKQLTPSSLLRRVIATILILLVLSTAAAHSQVASRVPFSTGSDSVNSAFSSIYYAEQNG